MPDGTDSDSNEGQVRERPVPDSVRERTCAGLQEPDKRSLCRGRPVGRHDENQPVRPRRGTSVYLRRPCRTDPGQRHDRLASQPTLAGVTSSAQRSSKLPSAELLYL